jgi:hypothetical protein
MAGYQRGTMFSPGLGRSKDVFSGGRQRLVHWRFFVVARRLETFASAMMTTVLSVPLLGTLTTHSVHHSSIVASLLASLGVCASVNVAAWLGAALVIVANVTAIV